VNVLVAGATGAIGRPLVRQLVESGQEVWGMTRSPAKVEQLKAAGAHPVVCDALDAVAVREAAQAARPHVVINQRRELGWAPRYSSWRQGFREALG
jgi:nucleoside-diphosphate-sugar epimerase